MTYILILGIEQDLRVTVVDLLQTEKFEAVVKGDSSDGVSQVMQGNPALIIMSEEMPHLDGVELLTLLRRLTASPIIVVGSGGETAVVKALLQGADMYISRPISYRELLSRIRALLRMSNQGNDIIQSDMSSSKEGLAEIRLESASQSWPRILWRQVDVFRKSASETTGGILEGFLRRKIQPT